MKKYIYLILAFILLKLSIFAQDPCDKGDDKGKPGCPDTTNGCKGKFPPDSVRIPVVNPIDPNEIIGPKGYDSTIKWVSVKDNLPYKILFENDPEFATAAAQKVIIYMPIHPKLNPNSLRLGDFGFGSFTFIVPPNITVYTKRLDVRDSLGVLLDVTAGLDLTNRRAFWIFESIDPATGLATTLSPTAGFLPVNDSTKGNGEGYVTLTIQSNANVKTRDSISAEASIIFDINEAIATNVESNVIDAVAPNSKVSGLPSLVDSTFIVRWAGKDDSLGVGVKEYALYYSKNNGPYTLYSENIDATFVPFSGEKGATYKLYTLATDHTGNKEAVKTTADQTVTVKGNGVYVSIKAILQGGFNTSAGMMTDSLRVKSLLPSAQPYKAPTFNAVNNSLTETFAPGVTDSTGNKGITDWVWLELRNSANPSVVVATRSALIRRDGNVVDMDGYSPVYFNSILEGNYYVAIRHRNHFSVMTAAALPLNKSISTSIDFTSPSTLTYGINAQRNVNGVMMMWAGDINKDRRIAYNGASNDKVLILQRVGVANPNNIITLYDNTDLNLDGVIRYNGASNDKTIILSNVGVGTPNNIVTEQLPN